VDAIVNAANPSLLGGGGVDGAIHAAGGPQILAECREIRRTQSGKAVITRGGNLPASYVIHTVGPIRGEQGGREGELLAACYRNSLALAVQYNLSSVAFPSISTGAYGYPGEEATVVSSEAIKDFLMADNTLQDVRLVFFKTDDAEVFLVHHRFG